MSVFDIGNETVSAKELNHGWVEVIDTPTPLSTIPFRAMRGIAIHCPLTNTMPAYIGRKAVTPNTNESTGGMPLVPGASLTLPVDDPSAVYVVAAGPSQKLAWMCL
jgi:hypothetical protein